MQTVDTVYCLYQETCSVNRENFVVLFSKHMGVSPFKMSTDLSTISVEQCDLNDNFYSHFSLKER